MAEREIETMEDAMGWLQNPANWKNENDIQKNCDKNFPSEREPERPKCRFCGSETKPMNNNGIIGSGYAEWNYACKACGKIQ